MLGLMKFGRRSPKNHPSLAFNSYTRAISIPVFPVVDYLSRIDWSGTMNGNDRFGDCVACLIANVIHLISTVLGGSPIVASIDDVIAFYRTQNPNFDPNSASHGPDSFDDGGMDIQTACEYLVKNGIAIAGKNYKAVGFVRIDHTNLAELRAATSLFGSILLGVNVAAAQQSQFPGTWDYVKSSTILGGHAILGGGHQDSAKDEERAACWAAEFRTTQAFLSHQLDEAWGVVWPWHLQSKEFIDQMDLKTFAADFTAITGQPFPVAVPTPSPSVSPDVALASAAHAYLKRSPGTSIGVALKSWLTAKGL